MRHASKTDSIHPPACCSDGRRYPRFLSLQSRKSSLHEQEQMPLRLLCGSLQWNARLTVFSARLRPVLWHSPTPMLRCLLWRARAKRELLVGGRLLLLGQARYVKMCNPVLRKLALRGCPHVGDRSLLVATGSISLEEAFTSLVRQLCSGKAVQTL